MNRFLRVFLGVALVVIVLGAAAVAAIAWKINGLKAHLLAGLGKSLGADVQVASFQIDPWKSELHAAGITLTNLEASQPWEKGGIAQATIQYHLSDIFSSSMPISVDISSWNVVLHSPLRTAETPPATTPAPGAAASEEPAKPHRIHVTHLSAHEGTVEMQFSDDRKVSMHGVKFDSVDDGGGIWTTQLQAASVESGTLAAGESSIQIRSESGKIALTNLHMQCPPGVITGEGEVDTDGGHEARVTLKGVEVPVTMLVSIEWQTELSGLATGDLKYAGNDQGGTSQGSVSLSHAKFNVLPWLSKAMTLIDLPDISGVEVDKATTDVAWKDGTVHLTNIDIRKSDVTRIAGSVDIDAQGNVDGKLKIGLPNSVVTKWPELQTNVFPVQLEDYAWADMHLTGTASHLQEDLSQRLVAAGIKQGGSLLDKAAQNAGDLLNGLMGK
jgi:hypothetical protein